MRTIEDKKNTLQGESGFNQVLIQVQLISFITICDYDEEKKYDDDDDDEKKILDRILNT